MKTAPHNTCSRFKCHNILRNFETLCSVLVIIFTSEARGSEPGRFGHRALYKAGSGTFPPLPTILLPSPLFPTPLESGYFRVINLRRIMFMSTAVLFNTSHDSNSFDLWDDLYMQSHKDVSANDEVATDSITSQTMCSVARASFITAMQRRYIPQGPTLCGNTDAVVTSLMCGDVIYLARKKPGFSCFSCVGLGGSKASSSNFSHRVWFWCV